jgi:hypothetical protein
VGATPRRWSTAAALGRAAVATSAGTAGGVLGVEAGVVTAAAGDDVVAVAAVEGVGARPAVDGVVAVAAGDVVGAAEAADDVVAVAAGESVLAEAADDGAAVRVRRGDRAACAVVSGYRVCLVGVGGDVDRDGAFRTGSMMIVVVALAPGESVSTWQVTLVAAMVHVPPGMVAERRPVAVPLRLSVVVVCWPGWGRCW